MRFAPRPHVGSPPRPRSSPPSARSPLHQWKCDGPTSPRASPLHVLPEKVRLRSRSRLGTHRQSGAGDAGGAGKGAPPARPRAMSRSAPTSPRVRPLNRPVLPGPGQRTTPAPNKTFIPRDLPGLPEDQQYAVLTAARRPSHSASPPACRPLRQRRRSHTADYGVRAVPSFSGSEEDSLTASTSTNTSAGTATSGLSRSAGPRSVPASSPSTERWDSVAYDPATGHFASLRYMWRGADVPEESTYHEGLSFVANPLDAAALTLFRRRLRAMVRLDANGGSTSSLPQIVLAGTLTPGTLHAGFRAVSAIESEAWRIYEAEPYARNVFPDPAALEAAFDPYLAALPPTEHHSDPLLEEARRAGRLFCNAHAQLHGAPRPFC